MNTGALGRREVIDTPPTHLQQDEGENEPGKKEVLVPIGRTKVKIEQIAEPSGKSPSLLGVPRPIVTPSFLSPQRTHHHT